MGKISVLFLSEIFQFLKVKFSSIYLNRRVFVMWGVTFVIIPSSIFFWCLGKALHLKCGIF